MSGLARGIDGAAHQAAIATGTVAVLAGGLDVVYPPEHARLHDVIGSDGEVVTTSAGDPAKMKDLRMVHAGNA